MTQKKQDERIAAETSRVISEMMIQHSTKFLKKLKIFWMMLLQMFVDYRIK